MTGIVWTLDIIRSFRRLHRDPANFSFAEIAARLSAEFNLEISRNACIGKARRIGLPMRDSTPRTAIQKIHIMVKPDAPIPAIIPTPEKIDAGIEIIQLNHSNCHWPLGKVEDYPPYLYCGKPVEFDRPYCNDHCKRAYNSPNKTWA